MDLLEFLSFGTWNTLITSNELSLFLICFWFVSVVLFFKLVGNIRMDITRPYHVKKYISYPIRIINVLHYFIIISIFSLFGNIFWLTFIEVVIFCYITVLGISCLSVHDCDEFYGAENIAIVNLEQNIEELIKNNKTRKNKINDINKRIYDYKKRTVIG